MYELREPIIATLIFYDIFNLPLTLAEIYKYLINPKRFSNKECGVSEIEPTNIIEELDSMTKTGIISHKNGFYFMPGRDDLYEIRIEKDKLANRKWKKLLFLVQYFQMAPCLRAVFASGSLATNNPEPKSDFDVFIVIKSGRLYTGRLFLWLISSILRARRGRFDVVAPDKLCFNHYITDDNLELSHKGLYTAHLFVNLKPIIASGKFLDSFSSANKWVNSYCYNFRSVSEYRSIKPNKVMLLSAKLGENILNGMIGDLFEKILKIFQQRRIKNNPATYESGGRVVFNDEELEFHPRSFEKVVIDKYNSGLKKIGVLGLVENDSGLIQTTLTQ